MVFIKIITGTVGNCFLKCVIKWHIEQILFAVSVVVALRQKAKTTQVTEAV